MTSVFWAMLLRPIVVPVFLFVVVAPMVWLLYRLIPEGPVKATLFKVRTGPEVTRRDKRVMWIAVIVAYAVLFAGLWIVVDW